MTPRRLAFALACASLLRGQDAMLQAHLDRASLGEAAPPPATLVCFEAKGGRPLTEALAALLQQEGLRAFEVPLRTLTLGSGPDRALLAKLRLPAQAQWALVGRNGADVLARGTVPPTADTLAGSLEQAGFRDRAKELKAYLKIYPDAVEAREQQLRILRRRAERTAMGFLGVSVASPRERLQSEGAKSLLPGAEATPRVDLSDAKPLSPTQDLEAWGAFAQELDAAFRSGQWRELDGEWVREARPLDEASPTLRVLYQRWQPSVEAALRQAPSSEPFWDLWLWMSAGRGGTPLRPLLSSLHPDPLLPAGEWPPARAMRRLMESARTPDDWRVLREHFLARWEGESHVLREPDPAGGAPRTVSRDLHSTLLESDWDDVLGPLLECCLRSGDSFRAESLLMQSLQASRWPGLAAKAAALARRCGQADLAARWNALRPPPASR